MKFKFIFAKRNLWKIYLFKLNENENIFNYSFFSPIKIIGENFLRFNKNYHHTSADPFLFVNENKLFVFYEIKTDFTKGVIYASSYNGKTWVNYGCVLKSDFHISYPQVFLTENKIFMIPETEENGKVCLYESINFPYDWINRKILIEDKLVDTNILMNEDGIFLLGTHSQIGLCVYFALNLRNKFVCIYKENSNKLISSRNAGNIIKFENKYYRIFQDCRKFYGEKIGIAEILEINSLNYSEKIINDNIFKNRIHIKNIIAHHHLSTINYNNEKYIAIDFLNKDYYFNTLTYGFIKFLFFLRNLLWKI